MREAQEVKRFRLALAPALSVCGRESPELNQTSLIRMQFQPELLQSFPPLLEESLCFRSVLKPQHHVVRVTNHDNLACGSMRPPVLNPKVENVVQVSICKQRRDHAPYTKGNFGRLGRRILRFGANPKESECCDE